MMRPLLGSAGDKPVSSSGKLCAQKLRGLTEVKGAGNVVPSCPPHKESGAQQSCGARIIWLCRLGPTRRLQRMRGSSWASGTASTRTSGTPRMTASCLCPTAPEMLWRSADNHPQHLTRPLCALQSVMIFLRHEIPLQLLCQLQASAEAAHMSILASHLGSAATMPNSAQVSIGDRLKVSHCV